MMISMSSTINEVKSGLEYINGISTKVAYFELLNTSFVSELSKSTIADTPNKFAG